MPKVESQEYDAEAVAVWDAATQATGTLGWKLKDSDPSAWVMRAVTPLKSSSPSTSEKLVIEVLSLGPGWIELRATIALRFQVMGLGTQRRRFNEFFAAVSATLAAGGP